MKSESEFRVKVSICQNGKLLQASELGELGIQDWARLWVQVQFTFHIWVQVQFTFHDSHVLSATYFATLSGFLSFTFKKLH